MNKCKKCGSPTEHKSGFSKAKNKPWAGMFCTNKACGEVEWERVQAQPVVPPAGKQPDWNDIRERKEEGMEWLNAKNNAGQIVSALIQKGEVHYTDWYATFKEITEAIYSFKTTGD